MSQLSIYRKAFINYVASLGIEIPDAARNIDDLTFTVYFISYASPYKNDPESGYNVLLGKLAETGHKLPELNEDQKLKLKEFFEAFCEILNV